MREVAETSNTAFASALNQSSPGAVSLTTFETPVEQPRSPATPRTPKRSRISTRSPLIERELVRLLEAAHASYDPQIIAIRQDTTKLLPEMRGGDGVQISEEGTGCWGAVLGLPNFSTVLVQDAGLNSGNRADRQATVSRFRV